MKVLSVRLATARAHSVFPVPGGPYSRTPFGGSIPRFANRSGCCQRTEQLPSCKLTSSSGNSTTSRSFSICSLHPPTSAYVTDGRSSTCMVSLERWRRYPSTRLHHRHRRIDLWWERDHDFVVCSDRQRHFPDQRRQHIPVHTVDRQQKREKSSAALFEAVR